MTAIVPSIFTFRCYNGQIDQNLSDKQNQNISSAQCGRIILSKEAIKKMTDPFALTE